MTPEQQKLIDQARRYAEQDEYVVTRTHIRNLLAIIEQQVASLTTPTPSVSCVPVAWRWRLIDPPQANPAWRLTESRLFAEAAEGLEVQPLYTVPPAQQAVSVPDHSTVLALELECVLSDGYCGKWYDKACAALDAYRRDMERAYEASGQGRTFMGEPDLSVAQQPKQQAASVPVAWMVAASGDKWVTLDYAHAKECAEQAEARGFKDALRPLYMATPAQAASVPANEFPHDEMDAIALHRFKVEQTDSNVWGWCVRAGDGTQELYKGRKSSCEAVARRLIGAFLDGAMLAHDRLAAAPEAQKS